jgi:hypothetical protein
MRRLGKILLKLDNLGEIGLKSVTFRQKTISDHRIQRDLQGGLNDLGI